MRYPRIELYAGGSGSSRGRLTRSNLIRRRELRAYMSGHVIDCCQTLYLAVSFNDQFVNLKGGMLTLCNSIKLVNCQVHSTASMFVNGQNCKQVVIQENQFFVEIKLHKRYYCQCEVFVRLQGVFPLGLICYVVFQKDGIYTK
jgi:hypothetical protein